MSTETSLRPEVAREPLSRDEVTRQRLEPGVELELRSLHNNWQRWRVVVACFPFQAFGEWVVSIRRADHECPKGQSLCDECFEGLALADIGAAISKDRKPQWEARITRVPHLHVVVS